MRFLDVIKQVFSIRLKTWLISLLLSIVLYIPEPYIIDAPTQRGYVISLIFNLAFTYSIVFVISLLIYYAKRISRFLYYIGEVILHLLIYGYSILTIFLFKNFHLTLNAYAFELFSETTNNEAEGFLRTYCFNEGFIIILLPYFIILLLELAICCSRNNNNYISFYSSQKVLIIHSVFIIAMASELRFFTPKYAYSQIFYDKADRWIIRTGLWNLSKSYYQFSDLKSQTDRAIASQNNVEINDVSYSSKNIVLIIGESFNRHHSSLYGYSLCTNPLLTEESNLFVFDDVISPYNVTTHCFKYFMSFASVGGPFEWCETPLFPLFFKKTGYNVIFYSNQFLPSKELSHYEESSGFMCHPQILPQLFSSVNSTWHPFDLDLVDQYKKEQAEMESDSLNLIIFHLNGQHLPAGDKYPLEEAFFSIEDINRDDLSISEKKVVADYDNACRYNDKVVSSIIDLYRDRDAIIIYFADHGEEINDFRSKVGRSFDFDDMGAYGIKCQLDIPFMIFLTNKYIDTHSEIYEAVQRSVHRPFMIDDLPHLLLGLAGIETSWYDEKKNLISPSFEVNKKRVIHATDICYDEKTKDL